MKTISGTEAFLPNQIDQLLATLPVIVRWLRQSTPPPTPVEEERPITLSQVRMLLYLFQNGPLTMGELAHGLGVSCSAVTECVDSLEERRAAIRHRSETDRRLVLVSMTPEVEAVAVQVLGQWKAVLHHALVQLSPEEGQAFVKGARLLAQAAESWMERNLSFEHDLSRASVPSSVDSSANVAARV